MPKQKKSVAQVRAINLRLRKRVQSVFDAYMALGRTVILAPPTRGRASPSGAFQSHVKIAQLIRRYQVRYEQVEGSEYGALACLEAGLKALGLDRRRSDLSAHARYGKLIAEKPGELQRHMKRKSFAWSDAASTVIVGRKAKKKRKKK